MRAPRTVTITLTVLLILCATMAAADIIVSTLPWSSGGGWATVGPQEPLGQPETARQQIDEQQQATELEEETRDQPGRPQTPAMIARHASRHAGSHASRLAGRLVTHRASPKRRST